MVQLSPDTRKDNWDACSGYHYSDDVVFGFSHTHLSGTGVADYGDIRLMPMVGEVKTEPGTKDEPESGYASRFDHEREMAEAGFYAVHLNDYNIYVGLTASERAGFHKYLFPSSEQAYIVIDLKESVVTEEVLESEIQILSATEIQGFRRTKRWADDQYVYFYAEFSKPFKDWGISENKQLYAGKQSAKGNNLKAFVHFNTEAGEIIYVKVGISAVDYAGAKNNLETEIPDWDFDNVRNQAKQRWNSELNKIQTSGGTDEQKEVFYTALYHSFLAPNLYADADGRYRGHDKNIYQSTDFRMHTVFSLWDTFRALHPLFTIVQRERTGDLINSMLDMYKHDSLLPVWELAACETNCMIGYNAIPVIADAYIKGITSFNQQLALEAMKASANSALFGLDWYTKKGYIPADKEGESVSKTLEYAYDDWCIAQMAKRLGDDKGYETFIQRAQYYKNIFDKKSGFFRGKSNGSFVEPFDPTQVNFMLTEANTWQYNFFVPQDVNTHIELLGGDKAYEAKLDELFHSDAGLSGREQSDITGLIGQYAHGNEPSHNMAYLYSFVGKPWKTQKLVHQILNEMYTAETDGLSGNEDCGQMSAWYVLSAMGFYPVTPGSDVYVLGTPLFDTLSIALENGKLFKVIANNVSKDNFYIQSVLYNGKPWTKSYITHQIIMDGGVLEFEMDAEPNKEWGSSLKDRPLQLITDFPIAPVPYFTVPTKTFENEIEVGIADLDEKATIYLTTDPHYFGKYVGPIRFDNSSTLYAKAVLNGKESFVETAEYNKISAGKKVNIKYPYSNQYTAGGNNALVNTLRGGVNFRTGNWQGYHGVDFDAVIDLGKLQFVKQIGAGFLQDEGSWIFMPEWVSFAISTDGKNFQELGVIANDINPRQSGGIVKEFVLEKVNQEIRYIHIIAKNRGKCPEWHKGAGETAWIFVDEVWME
jgi:predicted alpha-1,2-mannosidase